MLLKLKTLRAYCNFYFAYLVLYQLRIFPRNRLTFTLPLASYSLARALPTTPPTTGLRATRSGHQSHRALCISRYNGRLGTSLNREI